MTKAQEFNLPQGKNQFQEITTLYTNTNRFIPGERIIFKIENNLISGRPSFISKIAYIELIDGSRQSVLKSKIKLKDGAGSGHLYIPSFIKTGAYTLIAYTSWMQNYPKEFIAQLGIQIINPFAPIPTTLISDSISMSFYPEGGAYVLNQPTKVAYKINWKNPSKTLNVKVLADSGDAAAAFTHNHISAYGHFIFTPTQTNYKIVITDEEESIYYDRLIIDNSSFLSLSVSENKSILLIKATNQSGSPKVLRMLSWQRPNYQKSFLINSDSTLTLNSSEWPKGIAYLYYEGTKIGRFINIDGVEAPPSPLVLANSAIYKTREPVSLKIPKMKDVSGLTISISKVYDETFRRSYSSDLGHQLANEKLESKEAQSDFLICNGLPSQLTDLESINVLPDYRGQLLYGQLKDYIPSDKGGLVFLSSINPTPVVRTAQIQDDGKFIFQSSESYSGERLVAYTSLEKDAIVTENYLLDFSFVSVSDGIDRTNLLSWIEEKSRDVQIENNYYEFKKDVPLDTLQPNLLLSRINKTYNFDDYTRFPTVKDVIVEIVQELRLRERNGRVELTMPFIKYKSSMIDSALILVDGVPVTTSEFVKLNPLQFKKVDLVFEQLRFGHAEYRGVAMFSSISKDASFLLDQNGYSRIELVSVQDRVLYYQPNYESGRSTMPDYRSQLLWKTDFESSKDDTLEFYTSDLTGTFEVVIQGRNKEGKYVLLRETFKVVNR